MALPIAFFATILLFQSYDLTEAELQVGFYSYSCPLAEFIVRDEVQRSFSADYGIAPGILRLHFHDCFVRGCDGSVLLDSNETNSAEKDGQPNTTIRGLEVIDRAKARLETACKGVVSCADILALAARDAVVVSGGLWWDVPTGRRDGFISRAEETSDIPDPTMNLDQITAAFAKKGLSQYEMIALQGAHTIGRSHCTEFSYRLYNFSSTDQQDPSLDPNYAEILKQQCPVNPQGTVDPDSVVQMDIISPLRFENSYYQAVLRHQVDFTSDQTLVTDADALREVTEYALDDRKWQIDFVNAMIKMSQIEVLTGTEGEIRSYCRVLNR